MKIDNFAPVGVKLLTSTDEQVNAAEAMKALSGTAEQGNLDNVGIQVRQHDDAMLALGYSKKTWLEITIPGGQSAVIKITVPPNIQHHAEGRIISSTEENIRFRVIKDALAGEFPAVVSTMPVINQREDFPANKLTNFEYCGNIATGSTPSSGEEQGNQPIYVSQGGFFSPTVVGENKSVKGRYSSEGLKAVLIDNEGTEPTTVYYQYDWHEFPEV